MGTEVIVPKLPNCDLPHEEKVEARYDGKTQGGPWAYMCEECFDHYGVGLGTGRGQRLLLREDMG